jgi:hypothetical protein
MTRLSRGETHEQVAAGSDEELRALELDENTERVDLDDYEASKQKLAEMHQAEAEAKREAEEEARREAKASGQPVLKPKSGPKGGRPKKPRLPSSAAPSAMWRSPSASPSSSVQAGWCLIASLATRIARRRVMLSS